MRLQRLRRNSQALQQTEEQEVVNEQLPKRLATFMFAAGAISAGPALAVDASYTLRLMTPETTPKAALSALKSCRDAGFQVAVVVVNRARQTQVMLRDRDAGAHTATAAGDKAWIVASFKSDTNQLAQASQAGKASSGMRDIPRFLAPGGGIVVEVGGNIFGAIGMSGAPNGQGDERCAKAGFDAISEDLGL